LGAINRTNVFFCSNAKGHIIWPKCLAKFIKTIQFLMFISQINFTVQGIWNGKFDYFYTKLFSVICDYNFIHHIFPLGTFPAQFHMRVSVSIMVFNATFNNIQLYHVGHFYWWKKSGVPGENHHSVVLQFERTCKLTYIVSGPE
jgi:hypothetical protein